MHALGEECVLLWKITGHSIDLDEYSLEILTDSPLRIALYHDHATNGQFGRKR